MGKMLMLLVVGMGLIASYSMMQLNDSNLNVTDNASEDYEINQARNLAVSGVEHAMMELAQDSTWTAGYQSGSIADGTLSVQVERTRAMDPGGPDAGLNHARLVTATGTVQCRSITIRSIVEIPSVYIRPPGLGYGILSDGDFDVSGNILVKDYGNPAWNASIHTNSDLSWNRNTAEVAGDVKSTGTSDLDATLIAGGSVSATGTTTIIGSIIAKGEIKLAGTPNIYYRPMLDELASKIWEGEPERPRVVSYYE
jgi:hypothetical protein